MKLPKAIHRWNVSPSQAIRIQRQLASRINRSKVRGPVHYVAGLDVSLSRDGQWCVAAVVLWDVQHRTVVEQHVARRRLVFSYVPGLLSFREAPVLLAVIRKLKTRPDILMCDGQGYAHPRRFGIACHIGLLTGLPAMGCAKSLLIGHHDVLNPARGSKVPLTDREERVGTVLRTRDRVKPVYVSLGHRMDLSAAERITLACSIGYRLPEPTRLADHLSRAVAHASTDARWSHP